MSDRIEPAMTPHQWDHMFAAWAAGTARLPGASNPRQVACMIAAYNAALPDSDPRKITRQWLSDLRIAQNEAQDAAWRSCMNGTPGKPCDECQSAVDGFKARLQAISDALKSYLPPEP